MNFLAHTIISLELGPLASRAGGAFRIPIQNDLWAALWRVFMLTAKFPTGLEPFMIVKVTPSGNRERPGDTDLKIPFAIMDGEFSSQRISSFRLSLERAVREMTQDSSLAWTDVVFANIWSSITCKTNLGTPNQAACANAAWQFERTGNLILRLDDTPLIRTIGKSWENLCLKNSFDYWSTQHRQI